MRQIVIKGPLQITDVKQMHSRPSRRCYIYSVKNRPIYQLGYIREGNQRWYGWVSVIAGSNVTSVINPFFPMSDTAKGAIRDELGKEIPSGVIDVPNTPVVIYEFRNFEQMKKYFPAPPSNIKYVDYKHKK